MGPLLEVKALRREFPTGDETIAALKNINLAINAGEMVAIVGASGSGKSTLMNILGCLDKPSQGSYMVAGRETGNMEPDALAQLRREHFGFIFQRYHLLPDLSAFGNVEIPAIYAGKERGARQERAMALLGRLGIGDRVNHHPGQLSGGQQQRVSIARALMNGGDVILADEPTGSLDRHSGQEVIKILKELHAEGHTIIIVTHDMQVAEHANRIIEISDGEIIADRQKATIAAISVPNRLAMLTSTVYSWQADWDRFTEAFNMALRAMASHRLRTFLTMLGIIIGIASVVSVVALGEGSRQQVLTDISSLGTNTVEIFPGSGFGDDRAARIETLVPGDAIALAKQVYVDSVTPLILVDGILRYGNMTARATVNGVGEQYFRVRDTKIDLGKSFSADSVARQSQEAVIDQKIRKKLFGTNVDPIGKVIFLGSVPSLIIGVAEEKQGAFGNDEHLNVWVPYTTVMGRIHRRSNLQSISVRVSDAVPNDAAERNIVKLMLQRHGVQDFLIVNTNSIRKTIEKTTGTMTLLVSAIAVISLVVGGIGVMNIMLVSVTERTREIGIRMAVGARQTDIMRQFLIEAVLVCLFGGILGIALSLAVGMAFLEIGSGSKIFKEMGGGFKMVYSTTSIVAAFTCSTLIGVLFGFLPARNAAQLDPVEALARE